MLHPWIARRSFLRPLSVHQNTRIAFQFFGSSWPTHAIIQYGIRNKEIAAADEFKNTGQTKYHNGDEWGNAGIVYNLGHNMPVVNDEFGYLGDATPINLTQTQYRWTIWGIATAGGYISIGDNRSAPTGVPENRGDWLDAPEYGDIKRLVDFFATKGLAYWKMSSQNALKTSGTRVYVLAETGRQYLIYSAVGGTFSIDIAPGTYKVRRYNPRTGEDALLREVSGGGSRSFTMPDANDWVVYLKAKAAE
ncbi:MAG: putative collagen-binding domain-containing protein [Opitutaceae bacterium]